MKKKVKKVNKKNKGGNNHTGVVVPVASPFVGHQFKTEILPIEQKVQPTILILPQAYSDMLTIAQLSGADEIGWLGTVRSLGNEQYLIEKIYMVGQDVHVSTTEITEDGLGALFTELAVVDFEACEMMHFWGHVHPGNSTLPSTQDEDQMDLFNHNEFFIRGIFGRQGRAEFTFFDYNNGIRWNDVPWQIYVPVDESRKDFWRKEIKEKVTRIPYHVQVKSNVKVSPNQWNPDEVYTLEELELEESEQNKTHKKIKRR